MAINRSGANLGLDGELRRRVKEAAWLDKGIRACTGRSAAGTWANLACLCVSAGRQGGVAYGG